MTAAEFPVIMSTGISPLPALRGCPCEPAELLGQGGVLTAMPDDSLTDIDGTGTVESVTKEDVICQGPAVS